MLRAARARSQRAWPRSAAQRAQRTFGSVRTSCSRPSSKLSLLARAFFMNSPITDLDCPSCDMLKLPSLLSFITAGIDGKIMHASRLSRTGATASTICGASATSR
jgi:hypothetical protein